MLVYQRVPDDRYSLKLVKKMVWHSPSTTFRHPPDQFCAQKAQTHRILQTQSQGLSAVWLVTKGFFGAYDPWHPCHPRNPIGKCQQVLVVTTSLQFRWSIPLAYFGLKRRPSFSWERKTQQVSGDLRRNKSNISKKTKWLAPNQPFFSEPGAPLDWDHSQVISAVSSANSTWDGNLWKSFDKATANLRYLATMLVFSSILYFFI